MSTAIGKPQAYPHPHVNEAWLARLREDIIDPALPIVDAHHHLWERPSGRYLLDELRADLTAGHNVRATVFIQCGFAYRADGPEELRPVGETEYVAAVAARAEALGSRACAGIVGYCDFRLGEPIDAVLEAHVAAGGGRFKGIRQSAGWDAAVIMTTSSPAPQHLLMDPAFRVGLGAAGPVRAVVRMLAVSSAVAGTDRSGAGVSRSADPRQSLRRTDLRRARIASNRTRRSLPGSGTSGRWRRARNVHLKLGGQAMTIRGFAFHEEVLPPSSGELAAAWRPFMETCIEAFGAERCMFESNFPVDKGMCSYPVVWNAFKRLAAGCSDAERAALFHGTAARFYRLGAIA